MSRWRKTVDYYKKLLSRGGGVYLLEQPTGSGKSTLASILSVELVRDAGVKAYIFVRTLDQLWEYLERIWKFSIEMEVPNAYPIPLVNKDIGCMHGDYSNPYRSYALCRALDNGDRCPDKIMLSKKDPLKIFRDLIIEGKTVFEAIEELVGLGFCPYYMLRYLAMNSNVIVSTYHNMKLVSLFAAAEPYKYIIFIDEAHNMPDFLLDAKVKLIKIDRLYKLKNFFESCKWNDEKEKLEEILKLISKVKRRLDLNQQRLLGNEFSQLSEMINIRLGDESFLGREYQKYRDCLESLNEDDDLNDVFEAIFHMSTRPPRSIKKINEHLVIEYPSNPQVVGRIINSSLTTVLMSATLSPLNLYQMVLRKLGVSRTINVLKGPMLYDPLRSLDICIDLSRDFTSRYKERSIYQLRRLADFIEAVFEQSRWNTFVFMPSKEMVQSLYTIMFGYGDTSLPPVFILDDLGRIDPETIYNGSPKIFLTTHRSKASEGVNVFRSDKRPVNIVIYGLSIRPFDEVYNVKLSLFLRLKKKDRVVYGYYVPAVNFLIQAIGRFISEGRTLRIYLLESRLFKLLVREDFLPNWFVKLIKDSNGRCVGD